MSLAVPLLYLTTIRWTQGAADVVRIGRRDTKIGKYRMIWNFGSSAEQNPDASRDRVDAEGTDPDSGD
ncbi:hypothetical protein [Nocardiopsis sp. CNR-923]|uniref:hypothetical protein n=1 Tax=Nocardiopsis sp. CNR-923 TaxID=1904965 RepID=UPI0013012917|nr:hypothetical protein [Nocardiopsis sp. CNR-923]